MENINLGVNPTEKENAVMKVINFAFGEIERKYGNGVGCGETPKFYHNLAHTKNVVESAQKIAELASKKNKINASDAILAEIAASLHDIEQDLRPGSNERESARIGEEVMAKTGAFSLGDLEKVKQMILSTVVSWDGGIMKQSETDDYLTKVMADADLSSLGQQPEIYWETAQGLLREIKNTDSPSLSDQLDWAQSQIKFLSNHEFHTEEANELFPYKKENIEYAKQKVKELEEQINQ